MNKSRRPSLKPMGSINVVPYIDVMLVLLVIFMVTAPLMNPGLVDLPSIGKTVTPPVSPVEVIIKRDASLAIRDLARGGAEMPVTQNELISQLRQKQKKNAEQPVVISADKNVRYEEVIKVMDMLQQQQIRKVGLLVRSR